MPQFHFLKSSNRISQNFEDSFFSAYLFLGNPRYRSFHRHSDILKGQNDFLYCLFYGYAFFFLLFFKESHDALLEFGNNNLQILVHVTKEGVWKNPVLLKILSQQPVETEEGKLKTILTIEGGFSSKRIKIFFCVKIL